MINEHKLSLYGSSVPRALTVGSTVGLFLFSAGVPVGTIGAAGLTLLGQVALGTGLLAVQFGLSALNRREGSTDPTQFKETFNNPEGSAIRAVGTARLGGQFAFRNTTGFDTYRLILQCEGRTDQILQYFIGEREVIVNLDTGEVESPPWARRNGSYAFIWSKDGGPPYSSWPQLKGAFPELWTDDHLVSGISQILLKFISPGNTTEKYIQLYGSGAREKIETVGRREVIFNPSDPSQDMDDESTWKWSDNAILVGTHVLRGISHITSDSINWPQTIIEAEKCDALVPTRNGMRKRATASGSWAVESGDQEQAITDIMRSIGAEIIEGTDGKSFLRLMEDQRETEVEFDARKHEVSINLRAGPEGYNRPNICRVSYYAPERNYTLSELPLLKDDGETPLDWSVYQDEVQLVGEKVFDIQLPFCDNAGQAQQIARRLFEYERAETGIAQMNMAGHAAWGKRVIDIPFPEMAEDGSDIRLQCLSGTMRVNDGDSPGVEIPVMILPDIEPWNVLEDEALPLPQIPEIQFESELDQPPISGLPIVVQYPDNSYELRVNTSGGTGVVGVEASYRTYDGALPEPWQSMEEVGVQVAWKAVSNIVGDRIDIRYRTFNADDEVSYFSDVREVASLAMDNTVPGQPSIAERPDPGDPLILFWDVTFTSDIRVVSIVAESSVDGAPVVEEANEPGRTGDVVTVQQVPPPIPPVGQTSIKIYEFFAVTSDGTRSAPIQRTLSTDGPTP